LDLRWEMAAGPAPRKRLGRKRRSRRREGSERKRTNTML
jgi:hypothetical protein